MNTMSRDFNKLVNFFGGIPMKTFFNTTLSILILLLFAGISNGSPTISSVQGSVSNGTIVKVTGSAFSEKHTPGEFDYFDSYQEDWSCDKGDGSCLDIPSGESFTWKRLIFYRVEEYMGRIDGNPLYNINQQNTNFSTGRAFNEWVEHYTGGAGGLPNGSMNYQHSPASELFYVYHVYYDPQWPEGDNYTSVQDKNAVFWLNRSGNKITGAWAVRNNLQHYELSTEAVSSPIFTNMGCPECGGSESAGYRGSSEVAFSDIGVGKWIQIKIHLKMNTWTNGQANSNGVVQVWINGKNIINNTSVILSNTEGDQFYKRQLRSNWSGTTASELGFQDGEEFFVSYDDILINYSSQDPLNGVFPGIACVFLSNSPTWGSGPDDKLNGDAQFIRQVVGGTGSDEMGFNSWADDEFKFKVNLDGLNSEQPIYLYVTNWDGQTNPSGYKINLAKAGPADLHVETRE